MQLFLVSKVGERSSFQFCLKIYDKANFFFCQIKFKEVKKVKCKVPFGILSKIPQFRYFTPSFTINTEKNKLDYFAFSRFD